MKDEPRQAFTCYLNEVRQHALLSPEEEVSLCLAVRAGDTQARQRMIECNLRLVIRMARHYHHSRMDIDDLVEEGNLGLMHALDKYDPGRGFRFSTYAIWWIRQYIERGIMNQSRLVRLPVHKAKRLNLCLRAKRELSQHRYGEPSIEDIAHRAGRPAQEVRELLPWCEQPASLDLHDDDDQGWHEAIADTSHPGPERLTDTGDTLRALSHWMTRLKPRERDILALRFGLRGEPEMTFERIAAQIGVTRERARQIHQEALKKLRIWMREENFEPDFRDDT